MLVKSIENSMSLQEAAECIVNFPKVHYMLEGESGIGKSSIKDLIMPLLDPEYLWVYFDCAQKDLGDVAMPNRDWAYIDSEDKFGRWPSLIVSKKDMEIYWGERCEEYEPGCCCCEAWKRFDTASIGEAR
jgi:hypothetical protein